MLKLTTLDRKIKCTLNTIITQNKFQNEYLNFAKIQENDKIQIKMFRKKKTNFFCPLNVPHRKMSQSDISIHQHKRSTAYKCLPIATPKSQVWHHHCVECQADLSTPYSLPSRKKSRNSFILHSKKDLISYFYGKYIILFAISEQGSKIDYIL